MDGIGQRIEKMALELTAIRSVVGTTGETAVAQWIHAHLATLPYFEARPQQLQLLELKNDALQRKNVLAYIAGRAGAKRTVLCLGHIDTVGIDEYAEVKPFANQPDRLKEKLAGIQFGAETKQDLESSDWLFGRGIFDMKTGVAALLVMLEELSAEGEELDANLVFLGVADEEGQSLGMLSGVEALDRLAVEKGWEFVAAVDTDYMTGKYPGDQQKYVYLGSVGKLLPCFYLYGEETHAGEAFNGLDANLLASEVLYQIDLSTDLCDVVEGEVTLPPISLHQRDLKTEYSVQTANAVNLYFNYATHDSEPAAVLEKCRAKAELAFGNVIKRLNEEYAKYCALSRLPQQPLPWKTQVLTYQELYQRVKEVIGERIDSIIEERSAQLRESGVDDREFSLALVQAVHQQDPDQNAKIILYFAPPYYPHIYVKGEAERERKLLLAVDVAVRAARERFDYDIVMKKFYPYISDLSYCHMSRSDEALKPWTENAPAWRRSYELPIRAIQAISMPVVNIGPYGKDAHKLSERVCRNYSFDAMPLILERTLRELLK